MTFPKVHAEPASTANGPQRAAAPSRGPIAGVVAAFQNIAMLEGILKAGIALRLLVFAFLGPSSPDNHYVVIRHIVDTGRLPESGRYVHSFHPPLYHILAVPLALLGEQKTVQVLSLLCSIATLWILKRLISDRQLFPTPLAQNAALALAAFSPSLIVHSLYVSNDTLAFLLGAACFWALREAMTRLHWRSISVLGATVGLGLLTKGTFLSFVPVIPLCVVLVRRRLGISPSRAVLYALCGLGLAGALGSYKFAENMVTHGRPIVHGLDQDLEWARTQRPVVRDMRSLVDVNLLALVRRPTISESTRYSVPLLMYGTMWYKFIDIENNFDGCYGRLKVLGSLIYLAAIVPTILMIAGAFRIAISAMRRATVDGVADGPHEFCAACLAATLLAVALVLIAGFKYDVWSCFQARLTFHAFFGIALCLAVGVTWAQTRWPRRVGWWIAAAMLLLSLLNVAYFLTECGRLLG